MLRVLNNSPSMYLDEAESKIHGAKGLFVYNNKNAESLYNELGHFTYISDDDNSFKALMKEYHKVKKQGYRAIVLGEYFTGGVIGVLY